MNTLLFIPALLAGDINAFMVKVAVVILLWLVVIAASIFDLITGIAASRRTGQKRTTSWGLRRTLSKDLQYIALLFAFLLIDIILSFLSPYVAIFNVPICSIIIASGETIIEAISIAENTRKGKNKEQDKIDDIQQFALSVVDTLGSEKAKQYLEAVQKYVEQKKS